MLYCSWDGLDLESEGIMLGGGKGGTLSGWLSPSAIVVDEASRDGIGSVSADVFSMPGRTITIPVSVHPPAGTTVARRAAEATLLSFLGERPWLRIDDGTTARELRVLVQAIELTAAMPGAPTASTGTVTLRAEDPRWRATDPLVYTLSTARVIPAIDTAPVADWVIRLMNSAAAVTTPGIIVRDRTGEVRGALTFPGVLATTDHIELLPERGLARKWSGGTASLMLTSMTGGFVSLHAGDSLELTAVSGSPGGELILFPQGW